MAAPRVAKSSLATMSSAPKTTAPSTPRAAIAEESAAILPPLIRQTLRSICVGLAAAAAFTAALIGLDVGGIGALIARSDVGVMAGVLLFAGLGGSFAAAQVAIDIFMSGGGEDEKGEKPRRIGD